MHTRDFQVQDTAALLLSRNCSSSLQQAPAESQAPTACFAAGPQGPTGLPMKQRLHSSTHSRSFHVPKVDWPNSVHIHLRQRGKDLNVRLQPLCQDTQAAERPGKRQVSQHCSHGLRSQMNSLHCNCCRGPLQCVALEASSCKASPKPSRRPDDTDDTASFQAPTEDCKDQH